jgi:hypothetical protein
VRWRILKRDPIKKRFPAHYAELNVVERFVPIAFRLLRGDRVPGHFGRDPISRNWRTRSVPRCSPSSSGRNVDLLFLGYAMLLLSKARA